MEETVISVSYTHLPKEPKAENFNDPERYGEARTRYEQQWADYMEQEEEITRRSGAGEITVYAKIGQKDITFCYVEKRYGYRDCLYPASQFTGEGGYYLNFLSDRKKTFFAALGLSALAGYRCV